MPSEQLPVLCELIGVKFLSTHRDVCAIQQLLLASGMGMLVEGSRVL